jgi:hypothetical protein
MFMNEEPRTVKQYRLLMNALGALYAGGALVFFFLPGVVFFCVNIPTYLTASLGKMPQSSEHFWLPLAASLMALLAYLSFLSARKPEQTEFAWGHVLSKLVSSLTYLYLFLRTEHLSGYLIGFVVDLPIALLVIWMTVRMLEAKTRPAEESQS